MKTTLNKPTQSLLTYKTARTNDSKLQKKAQNAIAPKYAIIIGRLVLQNFYKLFYPNSPISIQYNLHIYDKAEKIAARQDTMSSRLVYIGIMQGKPVLHISILIHTTTFSSFIQLQTTSWVSLKSHLIWSILISLHLNGTISVLYYSTWA